VVDNAVAIVQARIGSSRLPGKVLLALGDRCLLRWVLDRLGRAESLDQVLVATSTAAHDDVLAEKCREWGTRCFRGSEDDVLGRFLGAAEASDAGVIVRVNADNPLIDPAYVDKLLADIHAGGADYVSYERADATPVMLTALSFFAEAMTMACLRRAAREVTDRFQREHVTPGIYTRPEKHRVRFLPVPSFCNDSRLRLTVDTQADLAILREVFSALGQKAEGATAEEVVRLVDGHPEWLSAMEGLNAEHPKRAKP